MVRYYDQLFGVSDAEYLFYRDFLQRHPGRVLEVGSGTGQLLIPLQKEGVAIEGVEVSQQMIAWCQTKAQREGLTPKLHHSPLLDFNSEALYQTIILPSGVFQLITAVIEPEVLLSKLNQLLMLGGQLLIDLMSPEDTPSHLIGVIHEEDEVIEVLAEIGCDDRDGLLYRDYRFIRHRVGSEDTEKSYRFYWRMYSTKEIVDLLMQSGFTVCTNHQTDTMILIAQRVA